VGQAVERRVSVDEYLALDESSQERHAFWDGHVWAMSGGTFAHDALSTAMAAELRAALAGSGCSASGPNLRVKSLETGLYTYADALVVCGPHFEDPKRTTLLNPRVIVEVLSDATEAYDRGEKFAHYRSIESLGDYVLVSTSAPLVEVYSRAPSAWELRVFRQNDTVHLPAVDVELSVDALYRGIELDPPRALGTPR